MLSNQTIEQVRAVDITRIIGHFIKLDVNNKAPCPLHNEKTASFSVSVSKQLFKCFGCGTGGDGIKFVQVYKRVSFEEAVAMICRIAGIPIEYDHEMTEDQQTQYRKQQEEKNVLMKLLLEANDLYRQTLWQSASGLSYLRSDRAFSESVIRKWGLGLAPDNNRFLSNGYSANGLIGPAIRAGLVKEKEQRCHDVFQNRIIFPIHNDRDELVSFAGRVYGDSNWLPKYINGHNTVLYDKSRILYGLNQAIDGIRRHKYAIIVEGYPDVISMHEGGADNTVGSCGTALTESQVRLLKRYTNHVVTIRDSDPAGRKAIASDLLVLLKQECKVELMVLPDQEGKKCDPDDFARQFHLSAAVIHQYEKQDKGFIKDIKDLYLQRQLSGAEPNTSSTSSNVSK